MMIYDDDDDDDKHSDNKYDGNGSKSRKKTV